MENRISFLNIQIDNLTMAEALKRIKDLIQQRKVAYVVTPNLDHIIQLENDAEFRAAYEHADLILADGKPLIWISKILHCPIGEKISGSDLFPELCRLAEENNFTMFFLGGGAGVAEKAAERLHERFPGLQVTGTYSPPYGFEKDEMEINRICQMIKVTAPDILIVALGAPKQEKFILHCRDDLQVPLSLGLGATLDFEAGHVKRAPKWMSDHGFEWLFRITQDPKRLIKRYWNDAVKIIPIIRKYK